MKLIFYLFLSMFCCTVVFAQQVVTTGGATSQTALGGISYTIGEVVTETLTTSGTTLTQGFQQTNLKVTAISEIANLGFAITAFPNPATDFVKLSLSDDKVKGLRYVLFDMNGKTITDKQFEGIETIISFLGISPASYILKIFSDQKEVKSFKIIKLN